MRTLELGGYSIGPGGEMIEGVRKRHSARRNREEDAHIQPEFANRLCPSQVRSCTRGPRVDNTIHGYEQRPIGEREDQRQHKDFSR